MVAEVFCSEGSIVHWQKTERTEASVTDGADHS